MLRKIAQKIVEMFSMEDVARFICYLSRTSGVELLPLAYREIGILKYRNYDESGETFLLQEVISGKMGLGGGSVIFDVGANTGKYTCLVKGILKGASIYAFEPNKAAFSTLVDMSSDKIRCFNLGFGDTTSKGKMFTYKDSLNSSHASAYPDMFKHFYKNEDVAFFEFDIDTIDNFCEKNDIAMIDFLKIDTEGNELNVIVGAKRMIDDGRISALQFEFGECDIFSRVFLKDFYDALTAYNLYRLDSDRLISLGGYSVDNEIFRYQNVFAIKKELDTLPERCFLK